MSFRGSVLNAFTYWSELQRASLERGYYLNAVRERARWQELARDYNRNALHTSAPEFAAHVAGLIRAGETVLEIGPGTGGFTLPVAEQASRVLALDVSEAMLAVLGGELERTAITNVETRHGAWPEADVGVHDVVLAVSSLYRVADVRTCIERMTAAARRRVIVGWSIGHNPPVLPALVDPAGARAYRPGVTYIHLLLALHELGIAVDLSVHRVQRRMWRASYNEAAAKLLDVGDPTDEERAQAVALARAIFTPDDDGVVHRYEGQVALICWPGGASSED